MKYRILSTEELSHFEEDLKAFLIIHGIDGPLWEKINREDPVKAVELVELFSDVVLQRVYENLQYLEFRSSDSFAVIHLGSEQQELILVKSKDTTRADLSTVTSIQAALSDSLEFLEFFKSRKNYDSTRELAIHSFIEQGCMVSDRTVWEALQQLLN